MYSAFQGGDIPTRMYQNVWNSHCKIATSYQTNLKQIRSNYYLVGQWTNPFVLCQLIHSSFKYKCRIIWYFCLSFVHVLTVQTYSELKLSFQSFLGYVICWTVSWHYKQVERKYLIKTAPDDNKQSYFLCKKRLSFKLNVANKKSWDSENTV